MFNVSDAQMAKAVECGLDVDPSGETVIESCTDSHFATLQCTTDCPLETPCGGLVGDDHKAAMGLAACAEACP